MSIYRSTGGQAIQSIRPWTIAATHADCAPSLEFRDSRRLTGRLKYTSRRASDFRFKVGRVHMPKEHIQEGQHERA